MYFDLKNYDKARNLFQEILERNPEYHQVLPALWKIRLVKSHGKARQIIEEEAEAIVNRYGENEEALLAAYQGYRQVRNTKKAISLVPQILDLT